MRRYHSPLIFLGLGLFLVLQGCRTPQPEDLPPEVPAPSFKTSKLELPGRGKPISDFERLAFWEVQCDSGTVSLHKNLSQALWGRASAEIQFEASRPVDHQVQLIPKEPWQIQSQFDTILLWIKHEGGAELRKDYRIRLRYRDAKGQEGEWVMPYRPEPGFQLLHLRINEVLPSPVQIDALFWDIPKTAAAKQTLYVDSLSIYQEVLKVIPQKVHYVRPHGYAPVFAPKRKNSVTLDFPSTATAFRPKTRTQKSIQELVRLDASAYMFRYENEDTQLAYKIIPASGFPEIEVNLNGKTYADIWKGASIKGPEVAPELRFARMHEGRLLLQYSEGVQFSFSLHGQTLQLEMNSLLENISALDFGRINSPHKKVPRVLQVPFMRLREDIRWPIFVMGDKQDRFLVSCFPDWWYSFASRYQQSQSTEIRTGFGIGEMLYEPRWRGNLNMFRERIYFTVSNRLQDVLPTAAAPTALYRYPLHDFQWSDRKSYPTINLMAIKPLDKLWEDRLLARFPDGEWRPHPQGGYVLKSGLFDEIPLQRLAELREESEGPLLDVPAVAQFPPWRFLDYDVRSVGGATYTQTLSEAGALLQQVEAEWGGGVISRGGSEWFWSGLISGIVPEFPLGLMELHPMLPHFAWQNIHPFSQILGLGRLEDFRLPSDGEVDNALLLNRLLALQVAYGAMGRVPQLRDPFLQSKAALIQGELQKHFAGSQVDRIAYWSGDKFLDVVEAIRLGVLQNSQLYIRLNNQTEIWVNGNLFEEWSLRVDGRDVVLPSFGFVVRGEGLFVLNAPKTAEKPGLSLLQTPEKSWVSSPQKRVKELGIDLRGSVEVQLKQDGDLVIDVSEWHGEARFSAQLLKLPKVGSIRAVNAKGERVEEVYFVRDGESWVLISDEPMRRVWISAEISGREMKFSP